MKSAHLPTWMLIIGYPVYWLEMYFFGRAGGHTTLLGPFLFLWIVVFMIMLDLKQRQFDFSQQVKKLGELTLGYKFLISIQLIAVISIFFISLYAAILPPHLPQEFDALNYHITLPRQHLLQHSFAHIPWATADFYFLPIDFALAPYWLVTALPNKFPQFLFFLGFVGICVSLVRRFSLNPFLSSGLIVLAIFGSHNVGIQLGTAMLDIVMAYLLLAALDSFLKGDKILCGIELSFYFWSKSFIPIQSLLIVLGLSLLWLIFRRRGWQLSWTPGCLVGQHKKEEWTAVLKKMLVVFIVSGIFIGGPFVAKSLYYTGTPLFPFYPGLIKTQEKINTDSLGWRSILENAQKARDTRDQYGSGRSPLEFLRHLWLIAVPEEGVNNRYDYPVGLMYLLFLAPFLVFWIQSLRHKEFSILAFFIIIFWGLWWAGSHQSRFLFVPIVLMFIIVAARMDKPSKVLLGTMTVALLLVFLSVVRAHKSDLGKSSFEVLREKDKSLLAMSRMVKKDEAIRVDFPDVAFAAFPVDVVGPDSVFILKYKAQEPHL